MLQTIAVMGIWLSPICITLCLIGCTYALFGAVLVRRFVRRPVSTRANYRSVTILKPLYGAETNLYLNLLSFIQVSYPFPVQVIFGVQSSTDPALAVVRRLVEEHPHHDIKLVVDAAEHGSNRKISNLINMSASITGDIVVLADSDMRVEADYLMRVVDALSGPKVGIVTCLYRGEAAAGLWSRLAAAAIDQHFLPSVIVGLATGLAKPCFGSTIALTRDALHAIGGFEAFANQLADDYAMGRAVLRLGRTIAIPAFAIAHTCPEASLGALFRHELRWSRTIGVVDPVGFIGSGVTHALPWGLIAAYLRGFDGIGVAMIALALASRLILQIEVTRDFGLRWSSLLLSPLRDLISFAVYLATFVTSRIDWRGRSFAVKADGTLVPLASTSRQK